jgi:hypothetical protein
MFKIIKYTKTSLEPFRTRRWNGKICNIYLCFRKEFTYLDSTESYINSTITKYETEMERQIWIVFGDLYR